MKIQDTHKADVWGLKAQAKKAEAKAQLKMTDLVKEKTKNKWTKSTMNGKIKSLEKQMRQWKELGGDVSSSQYNDEMIAEIKAEERKMVVGGYHHVIGRLCIELSEMMCNILKIQSHKVKGKCSVVVM